MTAAARQARYRARQKYAWKLRAVLRVEVDLFALTEALKDAGLIVDDRDDDKAAVEEAAAEVLDRWQKSVTRHGLCPIGPAKVGRQR